MFSNVFFHTQPTVIFVKFLHLVFDWYIWMPLLEVADDRLAVLKGQVQSLECRDI